MEVKIERNIPIPDGAGKKRKYPFAEMKIGDSVFFPRKSINWARATIVQYHLKYKFTYRTLKDGSRAWRIK